MIHMEMSLKSKLGVIWTCLWAIGHGEREGKYDVGRKESHKNFSVGTILEREKLDVALTELELFYVHVYVQFIVHVGFN